MSKYKKFVPFDKRKDNMDRMERSINKLMWEIHATPIRWVNVKYLLARIKGAERNINKIDRLNKKQQ